MNYKFKIKFNELPVLIKRGLHKEVDSIYCPFSLLKNDRAHGKGDVYPSSYSNMSSCAVKFSFVPKFTMLLFFI